MADASRTGPGRAILAPNVVGALWMLASAFSFSVMAVTVKYTAGSYHPALAAFYRQAPAFLVMLPVILHKGRAAFATPRPGIMLYRGAAGAAAVTLSFYAYQYLPLVTANALSFTRALWIVPLAILLLREQVGPLRIGATVFGFLGVLLMMGPEVVGNFAFGPPALAMLLSSFLLATAVMGMKSIGNTTSPHVFMVWTTSLGTLFLLPGAILTWEWPNLSDLAVLCLTGVSGLVGQWFFVKAMQAGDATAIVPVDYSRLIFAAAAGYLMFNELPTIWTAIGALVVACATLSITVREQQLLRRARAADRVKAQVTDSPPEA